MRFIVNLRRAIDRAELAEKNLKGIEEELQTVGENMKVLEKSAEKAVEREEKLKEKIFSIQNKVTNQILVIRNPKVIGKGLHYITLQIEYKYSFCNLCILNFLVSCRSQDIT